MIHLTSSFNREGLKHFSAFFQTGLDGCRQHYKRLREIPFTSESKWMSVQCDQNVSSSEGALECRWLCRSFLRVSWYSSWKELSTVSCSYAIRTCQLVESERWGVLCAVAFCQKILMQSIYLSISKHRYRLSQKCTVRILIELSRLQQICADLKSRKGKNFALR